MAGMTRIRSRGQVTLPAGIRTLAGVRSGDSVMFRVIGPGRIEIAAFTPMTLDEMVARFPIEGPVDWNRDRDSWEGDAAGEALGE